ncbi:MAG: cellulase family glycosylhydrolase [Pseudomonadota bacterium]
MYKKFLNKGLNLPSRVWSTPLELLKLVLGCCFILQIAVAQADVPALSVSGNKVLFGGQQASVAGNSFFWSNTGWGGEKYYNAQAVAWLKSDWKSTLVRAAMGVDEGGATGGGYLVDASNKTRLMAVVDAAIANDMYVIIDWHTHYAELYQSQSIAFFQEMATKYGAKNNVIYEIYNEPLAVSWTGVVKPYANAVIAAIRAIDPDNLIVVGTPNWSQDVDVASTSPITGYSNIAYTLHFYAGSHGASLRTKAQTALNNGIALFVTEWGSVNADGGGSVAVSEAAAWMTFMKTNHLSNANWSINDKAEGASALVAGASGTGGWVSSQLTASGAQAKDNTYNWPALPATTSSSAAASSLAATTLPKTIQAESFTAMSGITVGTCSDTGGGQSIGYIDSNDWLSYSGIPVVIATSGSYKISFRVSSLSGGGSFYLQEAGGPNYATVIVPGTGSWDTWTTISVDVNLTAGTRTFGINAITGGWNFNWFSIAKN